MFVVLKSSHNWHHPELPTSTWAGDGRPQEKVSWIEKGVIKNLTWGRYWAEKKGVKAIPSPDAAIMESGTKTLEELIKGTKKGVLVTRLWYIRSVDPQTLLLTGLPAMELSTSRTERSSIRSKTSASTKARSLCSTTSKNSANRKEQLVWNQI